MPPPSTPTQSQTMPVLSYGSTTPPSPSSIPPFSQSPADLDDDEGVNLQSLVHSILKAKKIAVVCGAGISCASGIPDFRSSTGLFETLKKRHPEARLSSGKDLFDASLFASENTASLFYTMIAELTQMSTNAKPTAFHQLLKWLDDEGKLFRVYTQNIDGLESKAGLSYGLGLEPPPPSSSTSRSPSPSAPPPQVPRCIPLHGVLSSLHCPHCAHSTPISPHLELLSTGSTAPCPACLTLDEARSSLGERSRGVGWLKPSVVLYGEPHPQAERVGEITRKDLMGPRPDLLLVVGTSLKVPGTKLLVRELAKVIRPPPSSASQKEKEKDTEEEMPSSSAASSSTTMSAATASGSAKKVKPKRFHSVFLNFEFPTPSREWKDTFDLWARGDVQVLADEVKAQFEREKKETARRRAEKEEREMKKADREREKEREASLVAAGSLVKGKGVAGKPSSTTTGSCSKKKTPPPSGLNVNNPSKKSTSSTFRPTTKPKPLPTKAAKPKAKKPKKRPPPTTRIVEEGPPAFALKGSSTRGVKIPQGIYSHAPLPSPPMEAPMTPFAFATGWTSSKPSMVTAGSK